MKLINKEDFTYIEDYPINKPYKSKFLGDNKKEFIQDLFHKVIPDYLTNTNYKENQLIIPNGISLFYENINYKVKTYRLKPYYEAISYILYGNDLEFMAFMLLLEPTPFFKELWKFIGTQIDINGPLPMTPGSSFYIPIRYTNKEFRLTNPEETNPEDYIYTPI